MKHGSIAETSMGIFQVPQPIYKGRGGELQISNSGGGSRSPKADIGGRAQNFLSNMIYLSTLLKE